MRKAHGNDGRDALVIVAKYPTPGRAKTRLGASIGFEQSARLYHAFLRDMAARFEQSARSDGYDLLWACADDPMRMKTILGAEARTFVQRGADFAERLYHISHDVAALGYARTIVLGSDSPQIPAETITKAFALLADADVVLGPADDGGYYLAGLHNQPTPPDIFTGIVMSTPRVYAQTVERTWALGLTLRQLAATFDVDTRDDLLRLGHALESAPSLAPHTHACLRALLAEVEPSRRGGAHGAD
jgi:uncharacterized protein